MRTILLLATIVVAGAAAAVAIARTQSTESRPAEAVKVCSIKVTGMTCSGCEAAVRIAAKQVEGVKDAKASYKNGTAEVTYDSSKTSPEAIARAIASKTGYTTQVAK